MPVRCQPAADHASGIGPDLSPRLLSTPFGGDRLAVVTHVPNRVGGPLLHVPIVLVADGACPKPCWRADGACPKPCWWPMAHVPNRVGGPMAHVPNRVGGRWRMSQIALVGRWRMSQTVLVGRWRMSQIVLAGRCRMSRNRVGDPALAGGRVRRMGRGRVGSGSWISALELPARQVALARAPR
jgi:hypothetical protein